MNFNTLFRYLILTLHSLKTYTYQMCTAFNALWLGFMLLYLSLFPLSPSSITVETDIQKPYYMQITLLNALPHAHLIFFNYQKAGYYNCIYMRELSLIYI